MQPQMIKLTMLRELDAVLTDVLDDGNLREGKMSLAPFSAPCYWARDGCYMEVRSSVLAYPLTS